MASLHCSLHSDRRLVSLWKSKMAAIPTRKQLTLAGRFGHVRKNAKYVALLCGWLVDKGTPIVQFRIYTAKQIKKRCGWMPKWPIPLCLLFKLFAAASNNYQAQEKITSFCETWQIGVVEVRRRLSLHQTQLPDMNSDICFKDVVFEPFKIPIYGG